jgi:hypothetical protein
MPAFKDIFNTPGTHTWAALTGVLNVFVIAVGSQPRMTKRNV